MAACFDVGCVVYWPVPTAPPWWAAQNGNMPPVRRIMAEAGERFWGRLWHPLYHSLQGNPFAAMPSLHFGTSAMAARLLSQVGPRTRRRRLGLRADARLRPRLPGRALRGRPARRASRWRRRSGGAAPRLEPGAPGRSAASSSGSSRGPR